MTDLQREFNRRVLDQLEKLTGTRPVDRDLAELRELLLTMELTDKLKSPPPKSGSSIDWWKVLPVLLTIALLLAAIVAALLGVDLGRLL